jgi:hypothetical protein
MLFLEESQNRKNISVNLYFYLFEGFINNDYEMGIYYFNFLYQWELYSESVFKFLNN